jgi:hypothetical protein
MRSKGDREIKKRSNDDKREYDSDECGFFQTIGSVKNEPMRRNLS